MSDTPEYQRQELALRMILAAAVSATQGFGAAELVQNLSRARVLCQALHDDATLVSVLVGLGRYYDLLTDGAAIEQHTDLARELGHPYSLCMALMCAVRLYLWCGALEEAERLIEEEVSLVHVHGIVVLSVQGRMHQGCTRVQEGRKSRPISC